MTLKVIDEPQSVGRPSPIYRLILVCYFGNIDGLAQIYIVSINYDNKEWPEVLWIGLVPKRFKIWLSSRRSDD